MEPKGRAQYGVSFLLLIYRPHVGTSGCGPRSSSAKPDGALEPRQVCEAQSPLLKGFLKGTAAEGPPTRLPMLNPSAKSTRSGVYGQCWRRRRRPHLNHRCESCRVPEAIEPRQGTSVNAASADSFHVGHFRQTDGLRWINWALRRAELTTDGAALDSAWGGTAGSRPPAPLSLPGSRRPPPGEQPRTQAGR